MKKGECPAQDRLLEIGIDVICDKVANRTPLRNIAKEYNVSFATLATFLSKDKHIEQYMRAREAQADGFADEIIELADKCRLGKKTTTKANGETETVTGDMVDRARLQIDARKWLAGKMAPKKYGDAQTLKHADADGKTLPVTLIIK